MSASPQAHPESEHVPDLVDGAMCGLVPTEAGDTPRRTSRWWTRCSATIKCTSDVAYPNTGSGRRAGSGPPIRVVGA